jgi:hypothetical protein
VLAAGKQTRRLPSQVRAYGDLDLEVSQDPQDADLRMVFRACQNRILGGDTSLLNQSELEQVDHRS